MPFVRDRVDNPASGDEVLSTFDGHCHVNSGREAVPGLHPLSSTGYHREELYPWLVRASIDSLLAPITDDTVDRPRGPSAACGCEASWILPQSLLPLVTLTPRCFLVHTLLPDGWGRMARATPLVAVLTLVYFCLCLVLQCVSANLEKVVLLGPPPFTLPSENPNLEDLHLLTLSPLLPSLRLQVEAAFPSNESQQGKPTWFLLQGLSEGRRYEVRVCWPATVRNSSPSSILPHIPTEVINIFILEQFSILEQCCLFLLTVVAAANQILALSAYCSSYIRNAVPNLFPRGILCPTSTARASSPLRGSG